MSQDSSWAAVRALSDAGRPLAFSSDTVADICAMHARVASLERIIPDAARALVLELVCRGHFLPFATAVVAALARIFVVERRIAAEAGAAVAALRVALALEGDEDVGEVVREETRKEIGAEMEVDAKVEVNAVVEVEVGASAGLGASATPNEEGDARILQASHPLVSMAGKIEVAPTAVVQAGKSKQLSLYDLMATDDAEVAGVVEAIVRGEGTELSGPPPLPFGGPGAYAAPKAPPLPFGRPEVQESRAKVAENSVGKDTTDLKEADRGQVAEKAVGGEGAAEVSEVETEEGIDDIFGLLE